MAVSWLKSPLITVLASCNIPEFFRKFFFFDQLYFCFVVFWLLQLNGFVYCICSNQQKMDFSTKRFLISFGTSCPSFDLCRQREERNDGESVLPKKKIKLNPCRDAPLDHIWLAQTILSVFGQLWRIWPIMSFLANCGVFGLILNLVK